MSSGAHLRISKDHIVIGSKETLKVFSVQDGTVLFSYHHQFDKKNTDGNDKPLEEKMEDICVANDDRHIAVIYSDKKLIVIDSTTWCVVRTATVNRRPTAITFQPDNKQILVADKSGGLYQYSVTHNSLEQCDGDPTSTSENGDENSEVCPPVLAHVSMLLDVKTDKRYIYTADRDEKIRVSELNHPYIIESYCLGHTEFVCGIHPLRIAGEPFLLSVSGDSTICLWDVASGKEVADLNVMSIIPIETSDALPKLVPSILSVSEDCKTFLASFNQSACPFVLVFKLDLASQTFAYRECFKPAGCKMMCDAKFSPSNHIYVLSLSTESEKLHLQLYTRSSGLWQCIDDCSTVACITSELKCFPVVGTEEWDLLYKARGDGQVYDSYFKRKAERLLSRNGHGDSIEYQHCSESDCNLSDAIVALKTSDRTGVDINPSECGKDPRGYNLRRYGSNMSKNKERKDKLSGADATWKSSTKSAPTKSSNRRESSSPDEGIVQSVDEMEDNELVYKMGQVNVTQDRTAITIEGGRIRESRLKRRSAKRERGNNKIKNNERIDAITSESHRNDHTSKVSYIEKEKASTSSPKTTALKVSKAEKAIARKVVRQALNVNSVARSYKPVWVKLPGNAANNSDQLKKRMKSEITKKSTVNEQHGAKDHEAVRTTRSKPHKNAFVHSNSVREVSRRMISKASKSNAGRRRHGKSETRNEDVPKLSSRGKDPPVRTNMRNKSSVLKVSKHHRYRDVTEDTQKTSLVAHSHNKRTVSADSSVRDLSYSSSSSTSATSSSISNDTSSSFGSKSISSSSYSSRSCYSNATSSNNEETHPDKDAETGRQTRYKSGNGQSSYSKTRPRMKLHEYWRKNVRSQIQDLEAKSEAVEQNSKRQAARDVEKTFAQDEEEEFEVNIGKKRDRNRIHQVDSNGNTGEDVQKSLWQHHRLVMTSKQNAPSSANRRTTEKSRTATESTSATKPPAIEDGSKDGASASSLLTIRDIYSLHNVLSDTQNGTVIAGHRRTDGMRVAIKRISKSGTTRWGWMNGKVVPLELALLCQVNEIRHPGVVEIIEWHETAEAFLLVMARPHPSVDLYDHVTKQKRLDETVARRITKQLLMALLHCQKMGVLHRDVKLENILFNPLTKEAILIDFGCGDYTRSGSYKEFAGTPEYYPPEWFLHKKYHGDSATVWSIGVLVYSLLCGTLPFRSSKDIINKEPNKFPADISHRARNFICETLKKKCSERITIADIINHPWLKSSKDNPEIRKTSV